MALMIVRSPYVYHINARSFVRSPDYSYDAVASSYNTHFCCTTNTPGRKTYRTIYYISLHNGRLLALQHVHAFVLALFSCEHFFYYYFFIILFYYYFNSLRISSLARHFGRIRSCNNCDRPLTTSSNKPFLHNHALLTVTDAGVSVQLPKRAIPCGRNKYWPALCAVHTSTFVANKATE